MADDFEILETNEVGINNLQIYQQDKALIDMQISTAKQYPRNLTRCIENAISIVTLDVEIAEECNYTITKGGKNITGASVHLAKIVAQQMGNMRVENRVVGFDATHVTCEAVCFDLERNFAMRTQIRKSILTSKGIRYSEDMCVITANAANSIALRNAIFSVIDSSIVKKVYKSAKQKITGDLSDETKLIARRTGLVNFFKTTYPTYNLTDEEIARSVGKTALSYVDKDDVLTLIGFEKNLKSGEQTPDSIFRPRLGEQTPVDKSEERILKLIANCKDKASLQLLEKNCKCEEAKNAYNKKMEDFK